MTSSAMNAASGLQGQQRERLHILAFLAHLRYDKPQQSDT